MMFQGHPITVGDSVFHTRFGYLSVESIDEVRGYFTVFTPAPNRQEMPVTLDGTSQGYKVVFWHDPHLVIPPKNFAQWVKVRSIALAAANII